MHLPKSFRQFLLSLSLLLFILPLSGQITCTSGGNLFVYANYDGGVLNLNVDLNIPNIKIGICTYEPVTINLTGPYVSNVTEVRYAGYVSTNNNHCTNSPATTTIVGAPTGATTSVQFLPAATLSNSNGSNSIVCAYTCNTSSSQGGCNTADQIKDYFETTMNATLVSYFTQYGCWSTTPYDLSSGGNCCSSVQPCNITANAGNDDAFCSGGSVTLNGSGTGNITSYSWVPATGLSNPNISSPVANPATTTTYVLTTSDGSGCSATDTVVVTVNTAQVSFSSPTAICEDASPITLAGGSPSGGTYSGPGVSGGMFNPATSGAGQHTLTYMATDSNGCSDSATAQIEVYGLPTVSVDPFPGFCVGDPVYILTGGNPAGGTWISPSVSNGTFDPTAVGAGSYGIVYEYTDSNGCTNSTQQFATVAPKPATPIISVIFPDSLDAGMPADSFHWYRNGVLQSSRDQKILAMPTANYAVVAWVNGCASDTSESYFVEVIGWEEGLGTDIHIYPNPAKDWLIVETRLGNYALRIRDLRGRILIGRQEVTGNEKVDISHLSSGIYLLEIQFDQGSLRRKILVGNGK